MQSSLSALSGALKLGFFVSGLTVASLAARLATADTTPGGQQQVEIRALAAKLDGRLSDDTLRKLFDAENPALFNRFDPGQKQPPELSAIHPFEGPAPNLHLFSLSPSNAQLVNAALPLSLDPNPPARPFVFKGSAEDHRQALQCLTQAVYFEAGFEPGTGQQAVAQVVLNRMRHPIFPHSVCGVVYQGADLKTGCQFSFTCDGSLAKTPQKDAWIRAQSVAEQALGGFVMKEVGGATHYHTQWVVPWWQPTVSKVAQVGAHIFYRWPGTLGLPGAFNMRYAGNEQIKATPNAPGLDEPGVLMAKDVDTRVHAVLTVADATPTLQPATAPLTPRERLAGLAQLAKAQQTAADPAAAPSSTAESVALGSDVKAAAVPDVKVTVKPTYYGRPSL